MFSDGEHRSRSSTSALQPKRGEQPIHNLDVALQLHSSPESVCLLRARNHTRETEIFRKRNDLRVKGKDNSQATTAESAKDARRKTR